MNTQLDELLKKAQYYTPSKTVTLAAGADKTINFTGLNSRRYGVNRILPGGSSLTDVVATVSFKNGDNTKFKEVHLQTLRNLFLNRSLRGAFEIEDSTKMQVKLKNYGGAENTVNVELIGYDNEHLQKKQDQYKENGKQFPKPEFVYIPRTQVAADANEVRLSVDLPAYKLRLYRIALGTEDTGDNLRVSMKQDQVRIKPEVYLDQINDEYRSMDIILPQTLQAHTPFELFVTNEDAANPYHISMLAECYKI